MRGPVLLLTLCLGGAGLAVPIAAVTGLATPATAQVSGDQADVLDDEEVPSVVTLQEAMTGATAMSVVAGKYLFVARPDGGYICEIDINSRFFSALRQGAESNAFANSPGALCVTARLFEDLSRKDRKKL